MFLSHLSFTKHSHKHIVKNTVISLLFSSCVYSKRDGHEQWFKLRNNNNKAVSNNGLHIFFFKLF